MTRKSGDWSAPGRVVPGDFDGLSLVVVLSIVGAGLIGFLSPGRLVRLAVGLPLLLFAPGYVTTRALFRFRALGISLLGDEEGHDSVQRNAELLVYSLGLSLGIVPLLGRLLVTTRGGFTGPRLVSVVSAYVVVVGVLAMVRRPRAPVNDRSTRASPPARSGLSASVPANVSRGTAIVVVLGGLFVLSSVTFAVAGPADRGAYTEMYLLANDSSGQPQATDYPRNFTVGEPRSLVLVVENHESGAGNYTVVTQLQRVDDATGEVLTRQQVQRFSARISEGGVLRETHQIRPRRMEGRLRLVYLLYRGEPPDSPSLETADQSVYLWVEVTEGADESPSLRPTA